MAPDLRRRRPCTTRASTGGRHVRSRFTEAGNGTAAHRHWVQVRDRRRRRTNGHREGETASTAPPTVIAEGQHHRDRSPSPTRPSCTKDIPPPPATATLTVTKVCGLRRRRSAGYADAVAPRTPGHLDVPWAAPPPDRSGGHEGGPESRRQGDGVRGSDPGTSRRHGLRLLDHRLTVSTPSTVAAITTTAAWTFPLARSANTVTVRNTVTCAADSTVGGTEDTRHSGRRRLGQRR